MLDEALKKTESALVFVKNQIKKQSLERLKMSVVAAIQQGSKMQANMTPDEDWLSGTNITTPSKNSKRIEDLKRMHVKRNRSRPKSRLQLVSSFMELPDWANVNIGTEPITDPFWFIDRSGRKKKHRRKTARLRKTVETTDVAQSPNLKREENSSEENDDEFEVAAEAAYSRRFDSSLKIDVDESEQEPLVKSFFDESLLLLNTTDEKKQREQGFPLNGVDLSKSFVDSLAPRNHNQTCYMENLSVEKLQSLLKTQPKIYKRCTLQIQAAHNSVCTVIKPERNLTEIEISGRSRCGKNFTEDEVVVEVLNKPNNLQHGRNSLPKGTITNGQVVGRLKRKRFSNIDHPVLVCELDEHEYHQMRPLDKTVPKLNLYRKTRRENHLFQVEIFNYDEKSKTLMFRENFKINPAKKHSYTFLVVYIRWDNVYPLGAVIKVIESDGNLTSGLEILELQHQIPTTYKQDTVQEVQRSIQEEKQEETELGRDDSTSLSAFTIDPEHSKDLDDALSVRKLPNGEVEVGIHISDVTSYIQKGDSIDREANFRARTFYQGRGKQAYHMLPEPLSQHQCSLLPKEQRRSLSTFFRFDSNGILVQGSSEIRKTMIMSKRKFTYQDVQDILLNDKECDPFSSEIKTLFEISEKLRSIRLGDSARSNNNVRLFTGMNLDSTSDTREAHHLVEEFMILNNKTVAGFVCSRFPNCAIQRCQHAPSPESVRRWLKKYPLISDLILRLQNTSPLPQRQLRIINAKTKTEKTPIELQLWVWSFLEQCAKAKDFQKAWEVIGCDDLHPEQALAWHEWTSFQEVAHYKCHDSSADTGKVLHFSLDVSMYIHFTSPIRRYADLINHRLVHAALENQTDPPYTKFEIEEICVHLNEVSRRAKNFENQCKALHYGNFLRKNPVVCNGFIDEVTPDQISLYFPGKMSFSRKSKCIALKLLHVSRKPEMKKDVQRPLDIISLAWHKRIFSHTEVGRSNICRGEVRIDPHQKTSFQELSRWKDVMKACVNQNTDEFQQIMSVNAHYHEDDQMRGRVPACTQTVNDISCEDNKNAFPSYSCDFTMSFSHAQILSVQVGADCNKGILEPSLQLLELTTNVKLCLQHTSDPVKYLAKYAMMTADKSSFDNVESYLETWLPLIRMEAATLAVKADSITINDVPVKLREDGGSFDLPTAFCEDRHIKFSKTFMDDILNGENGEEKKDHSNVYQSSDFLCFKWPYEINDISSSFPREHPERTRIWLAHGQVESIRNIKEPNGINVRFLLHPTSPKPPQQLKSSRSKPLCSVEIMVNPVSTRRPESALQCLKTASQLAQAIALGRSLTPLYDARTTATLKTEVKVPGLKPNNPEQEEALRASLSQQFTLIQGPPGTGKTYTGMKLIYLFTQLNMKEAQSGNALKQVVFCGPSNKSVDHVAKWTLRKFGVQAPKLLRMYSLTHESFDYPIPVKIHMVRKDQQPDEDLRGVSLHHLIRKAEKPHAEKIKEYDAYFRKFRDLVSIKNSDQAKEFKEKMKEFKSLKHQAELEEIRHYNVIFCTTAMTTNPTFICATKNSIGQCIIEECGMCTEPESMAAIIATQAKQVVLIGDHKQLRPVVMSQHAARLGLEKSLFERYADKAIFLKTQYRMNPSICEFVSSQFYCGKLETAWSTAWEEQNPLRLWKDPNYPYLFCHVEGEEEYLSVSTEEGNEKSCSNQEEVREVVNYFRCMVKRDRVSPKNINIMSQYRAQCFAIKESLEENRLSNFNVNTVVSSQGGEWDYVIFSTTRSLPDYKIEPNPTIGWCKENLGFITDGHQINVALSRARKGLVIIGNKHLLRADKVWEQLLEHYERNGCVVSSRDFLPRRPKRNFRH
ncbi:helicase with zinc finger domain 2-like isoform X2 [Mizuhopecten yessoensis]|nr:helicase with zinc finger domain 2-like isoform X2 [Mizuhopecten yessoensis]